MKLKLVNEQFYKTKSLAAARKYIEIIEFKRSTINLPVIFAMIGVAGAFIIMLFFR